MSELHDRIKAARKELRYSQEEVAKHIGINRTAVVEIEAGKRKVSSDELKRFCELFGKTADELLFGTDKSDTDLVLLRGFASLDEKDQQDILGLIEYKKIRKEGGLLAYMERMQRTVEELEEESEEA